MTERKPRKEKSDLTRVTINLTPKTIQALEVLMADGTSLTDTINKSLRVVNLLMERNLIDENGILSLRANDGREHIIYTELEHSKKTKEPKEKNS